MTGECHSVPVAAAFLGKLSSVPCQQAARATSSLQVTLLQAKASEGFWKGSHLIMLQIYRVKESEF